MTPTQDLFGDPSLREVAVPVTTVWTSPEAPRDVDEAAVSEVPDARAWADSLDKDARLGLHGRTETQVLMGEPVLVLEERDAWSRIVAPWQASSRDERGYPGWVRSTHLGSPVRRPQGTSATVVGPSTPCTVDADTVELSFGTRLQVGALSAETASLDLPGDRVGTVARAGLRLGGEAGVETPTPSPSDVLAAAYQFLGVHYLWGGTSSWGLDCSGLVHLACRAVGVQVPRDAHDQAAAVHVHDVPLDDVRPGDLYFFARSGEQIHHVGFVSRRVTDAGARWMLHAPQSGQLIEDAPMVPHLVDQLVSAGRVYFPA